MGLSPLVAIDNVTARGIRAAFIDTYAKEESALAADRLGLVMGLDFPSDGRSETYAYFESPPHPQRRDRGEGVTISAFGARNFTVVNREWASGVQWLRTDEEDDRLGGMIPQAQGAAKNFARLHERVFFQVLLGATNARLLPAVPNAPDGAAFFSATDGAGANRFAVAGGNTLAGSGVANADQIIATFIALKNRVRNFRDTTPEAEFRWNDADIDNATWVLIYNAANAQVVSEAFKAPIILKTQSVTGTGAATGTGTAAGVSNILVTEGGGSKVVLWPTLRVTDNSLYLALSGVPYRTVFNQIRRGMEEQYEDETNSDQARRFGTRALTYLSRYGYGLGLPINWCRATN